MKMNPSEDASHWLKKLIKEFAENSPANSLQNETGDRAWDAPLVGFSSGDDPLYQEYKRHISDLYLTPLELFAGSFPEEKISASDLTVISWILPHTEAIKADNQKETRLPSESWARARVYGETFNAELRRHVIAALADAGHQSLAPSFSPLSKGITSERYGRASTWSERHAAYASGLGTFGLCDGLITPVGKAVRCGSVIARMKIPATARPYRAHHDYCLFFSEGACGACIDRCPVGAISKEGHDKVKCSKFTRSVTADYMKSLLNVDSYACGLCQTGVPCESRIPSAGS
jgi:epoxyqueuosine reductase